MLQSLKLRFGLAYFLFQIKDRFRLKFVKMGFMKYAMLLAISLQAVSGLATTWPTASEYEIVRRWSEEGEAMCADTGACCPDSACFIPGLDRLRLYELVWIELSEHP